MRILGQVAIALFVLSAFSSCGKFLEEGRRKAMDMFDGQAIAVANQNDSLLNAMNDNNITPDSVLGRMSVVLENQIELIRSSREGISGVAQDNDDTETAEKVLVEGGVIEKLEANVAELQALADQHGPVGDQFNEAMTTFGEFCNQTKVKDRPCFTEMPAMDAVMILAVWHLQFIEARNDVLRAIVGWD